MSAALVLVMLGAARAASAHHSSSAYDRDTPLTIEGRLEQMVFEIVILGIPTIDGTLYKMSLLKEIRRPRDGWNWKPVTPR